MGWACADIAASCSDSKVFTYKRSLVTVIMLAQVFDTAYIPPRLSGWFGLLCYTGSVITLDVHSWTHTAMPCESVSSSTPRDCFFGEVAKTALIPWGKAFGTRDGNDRYTIKHTRVIKSRGIALGADFGVTLESRA